MYVNVKGKIWKVANEHVRAGTSEEMQGVEAVRQVFQDLQGRFGQDRRGVLDFTQDPLPPAEERGYRDEQVDAEGEQRGQPRVRIFEPETPYPLPPLPAPEPPPTAEPAETPVLEEAVARQRSMIRETTGEPEAEGPPNVTEPDLGQVSSAAASSRQSRQPGRRERRNNHIV